MNRPLLRPLAILLATACVAACATPTPGADDHARTASDRFKSKVTSEPEEIRLALHAQGLSPAQVRAVRELSEGWRETSGREINVQAPNAARDPAVAYHMSEAVRQLLVAEGVPDHKVAVVGYDAGGDAAAPLIVGYLRYRAEIPECGKNWSNIAHSFSNKAQPNFGCAVTANMTVQIADPADLVDPRDETPADAARRQIVLGKYRAGEKTGAELDEAANGAVSRAIE